MKGNKVEKGKMAFDDFHKAKGYISDYKKIIFYKHEVAATVLESKYYTKFEITCFDSGLEDVENNSMVLVGEVKHVKNSLRSME